MFSPPTREQPCQPCMHGQRLGHRGAYKLPPRMPFLCPVRAISQLSRSKSSEAARHASGCKPHPCSSPQHHLSTMHAAAQLGTLASRAELDRSAPTCLAPSQSMQFRRISPVPSTSTALASSTAPMSRPSRPPCAQPPQWHSCTQAALHLPAIGRRADTCPQVWLHRQGQGVAELHADMERAWQAQSSPLSLTNAVHARQARSRPRPRLCLPGTRSRPT